GIDEQSQWVTGQGMEVPARVDVFELVRLVIMAFGILTGKQKAFDFIRGVQGIAIFVVLFLGEGFKNAADIGAVGRTVLVDHITEDKNLTRSKHVRRSPIEGGPVDIKA